MYLRWRSGAAILLGICLVLCVALLATPAALTAQTAGTGALEGTLTDPSGAVVPNATVTSTNLATGQVRVATTGQDGTYKFSLLPPGDYSVKLEAAGFSGVEIPSVTVTVTETAVLDRALAVGAQSQVVTVEGSVETIQTASSALGSTVASRTMTELPLNTRNYTNLLAMSAGANSSVQNASQIGKGSSLVAVNGAGTGQNTYLQDGVAVDNWFSFNTGVEGASGKSFAIPPPDAISEFKIQTSSYDAGYGRNPGANVNVVTKSGGNAFHGTGFEFFRNTALNANDWFRNFQGLPKGVLNSNQFGGVVGGPIKKDKVFFFASYQETRQKNGLTGYGSSSVNLPPLPAGDRGTCPAGWATLSQCNAAAQAYVPALAAAMCPANHPGDTNFTSNLATSTPAGIAVLCAPTLASPLANINPVAISLMQLKLPDGSYMIPSSGTGNFLNTSFSTPAIFRDHNLLLNGDYIISSKHSLAIRYEYENSPTEAPFAVQNSTQAGNFLPGNPVDTIAIAHNALLKLTSILSPTLVNEIYTSYQRYSSLSHVMTPFTNSQAGIADLDPAWDKLTFFTITGAFQFGGQYQFGTNNPVNQYRWGDQISWNHGRNTVRAGFDAERVQVRITYPSHAGGNVIFPKFADFLIGRPAGSTALGGNGSTASNINSIGAFTTANASTSHYYRILGLSSFVQDDFKFSPRLTLNAGVRWEYDGYVTEANGFMSNLWPSLITTAGLPGNSPATGTLSGYVVPGNYNGPAPAGLYVNSNDSLHRNGSPLTNFAPRLGFAWQPTGTGRWVVRGGSGFFYDVIPGVTLVNLLQVTNPARMAVATGGSALAPASLQNPWILPQGIVAGPQGTVGFAPRWVNTTNNTSSNLSQGTFQQDMTVPVTYQWNLSTQYEFKPGWVLELGYVGSRGIHHVVQSRAGLQGQASAELFNVAELAGVSCTSCALTGVTTNSVANVPLRVRELGVSSTTTTIATDASYKFNSLQATVRKQFTHGFQLQAAYTFSRGFITNQQGVNTAPYLIQSYEPNNNYRPHRLVLNYSWNLPFSHPKGFMRHVAEGWTLSGVTVIQDGVPMTITDTVGSIFFGGQGQALNAQLCPGMTYANLLTSGSLEDRVTSGLIGGPGYLNGKKQGVICNAPAIGNGTGFGNMGGGVVLSPGQSNWDMSLAKNFAIREGQTLQFRSEFFNAFNHAQFSLPNLAANNGNFGQITSTSVNPRIIQLALKYSF